MCWQLDLPAVVTVPGLPGRELAGLACHLLPGLMTAGATDGGYLLLDLESLLVTACDGPPELIDRVVTTLATELATGQWSGWYDLILVGYDELEVLGRAEHCASLDQALALIEARCARVAPRIAERAPAEVRELRLAEPDNEDWGLTILVSRTEPDPGQLTRLLALTEDGPGGIAALIAGDPEAADGRMAPTALQLAPDPTGGIVANVVPLQISVRPRALTAAEYDSIATLLAVAADLTDVGQDEVPYAMYAAPPWIPQAAELEPLVPDAPAEHLASAFLTPPEPEPDRDEQQPALPLEVRILGPFLITGAAGPLQPKQAELVLALALAAPAGLSNSALCAILGADPDHPKPTDAVRQLITRTRRRLGLAADGQEHIIHAGNGQYLLHPDVGLDWSRFRALIAAGRADDLRRAMSLITGQPFTGSYFWWINIPLIETVRAELVDAAETLAEFELATGSARAAAKAARTGLLAESSAEQLWRLIMRAEHAAGNLAGVAEAWRRCLDAIEDVAPGGEPHPETEALYRQLTVTGVAVSR
jgi:DNA-binding SARP family transcriptional activator